MTWQQKKVLVTGAGGFIGSHLTERLVREGAKVNAFVRYNANNHRGWLERSPLAGEIHFFAGDLGDRDSLRRAMTGVDAVFHLGALIAIPYSYESPASYVRTNVEGTLNVLQLARDLAVPRVVHTSTSEVYGTALYVPIDEKHPLQGQSPYSASKIGADKMAEAFFLSFNVPVTTVRPFNTYGPRQSARAVIPTIISQYLTRDHVHLGNLTPTRDFNFVEDTVSGFLAAASSDRALGETINFGSGKEISVGDLVQLVGEVMGRRAQVVNESVRLRPEGSEVDRLLANADKARELLGWTPQNTLRQGLAKTVAWIEENIALFKTTEYNR